MSKVITSEELGSCQRLELPDVSSTSVSSSSGGGFVTVEELNQIQKQAYEEGFALGKKEGLAAGQAEVKSQLQRLQKIMHMLANPVEDVNDQVMDELTQLVIAIARQMVRRELKTEPGQVIAIVREALGSLPVASRNVRLQLNPEDAALIREVLPVEEGSHNWQIVEDPVMTRGGCRVETDTSQIDATVEKRFASIVATLMGGEREDD